MLPPNPPPPESGPAVPPAPSSLEPPFAARWLGELRASEEETTWIWHGYLAAGAVTLLTSPWKVGKTTLLSILLDRLQAGGQLAGRPVSAGKAVVVSEESTAQWLRRCGKLNLADHVCLLSRPFRGRPTLPEWLRLLDFLLSLHREHRLALAVIDPLALFLPGRDENNTVLMLEALVPLQCLTKEGLAVLLLHHPRKKESALGQISRGSGALTACVDVLVEMSTLPHAAAEDRRRRLLAWSRFDETPRSLVVELNADGTDYHTLGNADEEEFARGWAVLLTVLEEAGHKLTRQEILKQWPPDHPAPEASTLWRWLDRAVAENQVCRDGSGRRSEPFRYWLASRVEQWRKDPLGLQEHLRRDPLHDLLDRLGIEPAPSTKPGL